MRSRAHKEEDEMLIRAMVALAAAGLLALVFALSSGAGTSATAPMTMATECATSSMTTAWAFPTRCSRTTTKMAMKTCATTT